MTAYIAIDTETHLIKGRNIAPKMVCYTVAYREKDSILCFLKSSVDDGYAEDIDDLFDVEAKHHLVFHNAAFDLGVFMCNFPSLAPKIFKLLEQNRIHDTKIRQQLIDLSTFGHMKTYKTSEDVVIKIGYSLSALEGKYLGLDRSDQKEEEDAWRFNYSELERRESSDWPQEAIDYAKEDAINTLRIFYHQEEMSIKISGERSTKTETFQVGVDFCLFLATCKGICIDEEARDQIKEKITEDIQPLNQVLIEMGILRPYEPPRPYKNSPGKLTKGKKETINQAILSDLVTTTCKKNDIKVALTPTGRVALGEEVLQDLTQHSTPIEAYVDRQATQKILTTEIPRMSDHIIHFPFNVLKETGRTSSSASKLYPSANGQNIDPRVRQCYQARPGMLLCSVDYSQAELGTLAQTTFDLLGHSTLREILCAGVDAHAFLGAQLAFELDEDFGKVCRKNNSLRADQIYEAFILCKDKSNQQSIQQFYLHYRTFAKPTGLGYPGGLGPKTFVLYAKTNYGLRISLETAQQLRNVWFNTFPEMREYFEWIQENCQDPSHPDKFAYISPMGMYRANCSFPSIANGKGLQTPAGEGAKLAIWLVQRACYDSSEKSILYGCSLLNFLHDELIVEVPDDHKAERRANEVSKLMIEAMKEICIDVPVKAEPTLMYRWDKFAEPSFNQEGNLVPSNTREFSYNG